MGHREQAQFDRAGWKIGLLILVWLMQITLMLCLMGLFSFRLADTVDHWTDEEHTFKVPVVLLVWECTNVGLNLLALILTFIEIGKFAAETLTPFSMLFTQVIKLTCGFANLALDIVVIVEFPQGHWSIVGVAIGSGLVATGLLPLIYTIIVYRRVAEFEEYSHPANIKHYGFSGEDTTYPSQTSRPTSYNPGGLEAGAAYEDRPENRRMSSASSAFSISTLKHSMSRATKRESVAFHDDGDLGDGRGSQPPIPLDALGARRTSYNHERDTQFDDFLRRHSSVSMKSQIDKTLAAEFGWGDKSPTATTPGSAGTPGTPQTASSGNSGVLGAGVVKTGRPRGGSNRSMSHEAQLITVPERVEEEEPEASVLSESKVQEGSDDKMGLLAYEEERPMGARSPSPPESITVAKRRREDS
ncbi:uncharacterized protein MKZ38_003940 [Zalerion maritima]|uniref:Uncharacterized protein n=1 Tax=Zalerion maritima TaxID=339359 RepID=A0AAD5RMA1_9PEZI|nr:uncharacterized protein MKZ38_003940 [Zalerion maritima]